MSTPKEKQVLINIIEMYKNMPFLWDKNHEDYKNKHKRNNAKEILLEEYRKLDETASMYTFTKKILNLRTNFYKELRKVKESRANLEDDGQIYVPTLWYFNAFSFLADIASNTSDCCHSVHQDPLKTGTSSPSTSEGEESYHNSETYSTPPVKKRRFTNPIVYKSNNKSRELAVEPSQMNNEEWEIFGKAIGLQLRDLDRKQLTIAQKIISDAIYYAKFGLLSQNTYINVGSPPP